MAEIHVLSSETINRIAAGEVVERPVNVVKELVENSIDSGADAISVEIRDGGRELIRVTDNGCGIEASQVPNAFRRHATSKIRNEQDLLRLSSLGFRGEALSSIAAVSMVEMITKTPDAVVGTHATNVILPGHDAADESAAGLQTTDVIPLEIREAGAPDGTSVIVRNLFYNVPVRRRFLKTAQTEGGYITDLIQHMALSHPDISFHYRMNGQEKLHTTGSGNIPEIIYRIYGKEIKDGMILVHAEDNGFALTGYLARPEFSRSSRSFELFFVNGRILNSDVLSRSLEAGYGTDLMQHRFPFAILYLTLAANETDVNVHPSKMEVRFARPKELYDFIECSVHDALHSRELVVRADLNTAKEEQQLRRRAEQEKAAALKNAPHFEPFETSGADTGVRSAGGSGTANAAPAIMEPSGTEQGKPAAAAEDIRTYRAGAAGSGGLNEMTKSTDSSGSLSALTDRAEGGDTIFEEDGFTFEQTSLFDAEAVPDPGMCDNNTGSGIPAAAASAKAGSGENQSADEDAYSPVFTREAVREWRIVGQIFRTYWIVEYKDTMLMIDQHAAHEKVNFERLMKRLHAEQASQAASQLLSPPIIVSLTGREEAAYQSYADTFARMGYEIEAFGEGAYALRAVPLELYGNEPDQLLKEILDEILTEKISGTPDAILYKIASMSCKAAVKGNMDLSYEEAQALIAELLSLKDPYHCPHGRPTMIRLSRSEVERKFKRIV